MLHRDVKINRSGFTLIELLAVLGVIGLLILLSVVALGSAREKERDSRRVGDLRSMQAFFEVYFVRNGRYPVSEEPIVIGPQGAQCLGSAGFGARDCEDAVAALLPQDPGSGQYIYASQDGQSYRVQAVLEGEREGFSGPVLMTPSGLTGQ